MNVRRKRVSVLCLVVLPAGVALPFTAEPAAARSGSSSPPSVERASPAWQRNAARAESAFVADINTLRATRGLRPLQVRPNLIRKSRNWAGTMAAARRIWHSRISDGVTGNWRKLGENVGMGPSEPALHAAFVASGSHFRNLVDPHFTYVGVGVVEANGLIFVAQTFMQASRRAHGRPVRAPPRRMVHHATLRLAGDEFALRRWTGGWTPAF